MAISTDELLRRERDAYALHCEVSDELRREGAPDPLQAGIAILSQGVRFSAVFRDVNMGMPFFSTSLHLLSSAIEGVDGQATPGVVEPRAAFLTATAFWGRFAAQQVVGAAADASLLVAAVRALEPAFIGCGFQALCRRIDNGSETVSAVSVVGLMFLGLRALAGLAGAEQGLEAVGNLRLLPVQEPLQDIRDCFAAPIGQASPDFIERLDRSYRKVFGVHSYQDGLVAGWTFEQLWVLSSVRMRGDLKRGAESLLW